MRGVRRRAEDNLGSYPPHVSGAAAGAGARRAPDRRSTRASAGWTEAWYAKVFSAKPLTHDQNQAAEIPGASLNFVKADRPTVTTKGRALDHIGFDVKNLAVC